MIIGEGFRELPSQPLQQYLNDIIDESFTDPDKALKDRLMQRLRELIPFDMALWGSGHIQGLTVHNTYLYKLPPVMMEAWESFKHQDRLLAGMIETPGVTFDVYDFYARDERKNLEIYKQHAAVFNVENAISTAIPDPETGLLEIMSLYRSRADEPFSADERELKQFVFPLMVKLWRQGQIQQLKIKFCDASGGAAAICDGEGWLRYAEPKFLTLVKDQWPDWAGPALPAELDLVEAAKDGEQYRGSEVVVESAMLDDLILVQAWPRGSMTMLTPREEQIAESYAAGLTYKEIATELDLAPSTVRSHIESIYRKLEVSNKVELFQLVSQG